MPMGSIQAMRFRNFLKPAVLVVAFLFVGGFATLAVTGAHAQIVIDQLTQEEADALIAELAASMPGGGGTPDGVTPAVEDI